MNIMTGFGEEISSELLDNIETFLIERVGISTDGTPNNAMALLQLLQAERADAEEA